VISLRSKILGVLLIVVTGAIGVQIYLENRHCQFPSDTSASTMQPYDSKFDPCYIDRPMSTAAKILPISLALLIGLSFVSGLADLRGHKKRETSYE